MDPGLQKIEKYLNGLFMRSPSLVKTCLKTKMYPSIYPSPSFLDHH